MSWRGFEMYQWPHQGGPLVRYINIPDLISQQHELLTEFLGRATVALENEEREHRAKWRDQPLRKALDIDGALYAFEKLSEGVQESPSPSMGEWGLEAIEERLERFAQGIRSRGLAGALDMSVDPLLADLKYPIARLREFLTNTAENFSETDAEIFVYYVYGKFKEAAEIAAEIDPEYDSDDV